MVEVDYYLVSADSAGRHLLIGIAIMALVAVVCAALIFCRGLAAWWMCALVVVLLPSLVVVLIAGPPIGVRFFSDVMAPLAIVGAIGAAPGAALGSLLRSVRRRS